MSRTPKIIPDKEGQKRSNQHLKDREENTPVYKSQNFIAPAGMREKELVYWEWLVSVFRDTVNCRASDADIQLMKVLCKALVDYDEADEAYAKDPRPYILVSLGKDKEGNLRTTAKPNPHKKDKKENAAIMHKYFDQLGLSPQGRAKAGLGAANAKDNMDIFRSILERSDD